MPDQITPENILRLALLTNDDDALRKIFREHRDLFLLAAQGGLGPTYQQSALPVILNFLEEEKRGWPQQSPELAPPAPMVQVTAMPANKGARMEHPLSGSSLAPHSPILGMPSDILPSARNAIVHGVGKEQMGYAVSSGGACCPGERDAMEHAGTTARLKLNRRDGDAEEVAEGNSPYASSTDSISTIIPGDASESAFERCDECVRAWAICTQSPLFEDPPTTCTRCSLRGLLCRPSPEVAYLPPLLQTPAQDPVRPTAIHTETPAGPQGSLATPLAMAQHLNSLMAEANQKAQVMWQLHNALGGAIRSADRALGYLAHEPPSGVATASFVKATDSVPPFPRPIQRTERGYHYTPGSAHSMDRRPS
ncbi:hypothetical protein FB107DRAFT_280157 [Schizophyllum commune]